MNTTFIFLDFQIFMNFFFSFDMFFVIFIFLALKFFLEMLVLKMNLNYFSVLNFLRINAKRLIDSSKEGLLKRHDYT